MRKIYERWQLWKDRKLRAKCLDFAVKVGCHSTEVLPVADGMFRYIRNGDVSCFGYGSY